MNIKMPLVIAVVCLALAAMGGSCLFFREAATDRPIWYYDLNTNTLFSASGSATPPIAAPSGDQSGAAAGTRAGVQALVVQMDGKDTVIMLSTTDPQGVRLVCRPTDMQWQPAATPAGLQVIQDTQLAATRGRPSLPR